MKNWVHNCIPFAEYPSSLQATSASSMVQWLPHTDLHSPLIRTSTKPERLLLRPTRRIPISDLAETQQLQVEDENSTLRC